LLDGLLEDAQTLMQGQRIESEVVVFVVIHHPQLSAKRTDRPLVICRLTRTTNERYGD
jgi:hypothetical protein